MIIFGYPGIGKTTICKDHNCMIDLDSSYFNLTGNKKIKDWYINYFNLGQMLSNKGNTVFMSCHTDLLMYALNNTTEYRLGLIIPDIKLKDKWIKRLEDRMVDTTDPKEFNSQKSALERAESHYYSDITFLNNFNFIYETDFVVKTLTSNNYNLLNIIKDISKVISADKNSLRTDL